MTEARPLTERIYDGEQSKQVLENPAFAKAFDDIKSEYTNAWMNSPARDAEGREKLYLMVKLAEKLQATLTLSMEDGKMARIQMEYERDQLARHRAQDVDTRGWNSPRL